MAPIMAYSDNFRLSGMLQTVKTVEDCQDSCRLSRQLQTVNATQTVANCQDNCRQLNTFADMFVFVCSLRCNTLLLGGSSTEDR